jgi:hypothetical protein
LLTLARSDRGPGPSELVDLPTAVEDAIDSIAPAAAARQIQISTALQDAQVTGDRVLLERLVSNLIDNAVKHNVTGGWVLASTRTGAGSTELTVANGGEHIPADQVTGLFEPFRRLCGRTGTRPVHRRIGRQRARRPRPGPRQTRRRTGRADHAACHGQRIQVPAPIAAARAEERLLTTRSSYGALPARVGPRRTAVTARHCGRSRRWCGVNWREYTLPARHAPVISRLCEESDVTSIASGRRAAGKSAGWRTSLLC